MKEKEKKPNVTVTNPDGVKQKTPTVTVTDANGNKLVKDTDYTVSFANATRKGVGRYKVTVTLKNNYSGTKALCFTIRCFRILSLL